MKNWVTAVVVLATVSAALGQQQKFSFRARDGSDFDSNLWDPANVGTGPAPVNDLVIDVTTDVSWDANLADGFSVTIDTYLYAGPGGMKSAAISLNGPQSISYNGAVDWLDVGFVQNFDDIAAPPFGQPRNAQGWSTSTSDVVQWQAGHLDEDQEYHKQNYDLDGGAANEIGTISADVLVGSTDGFFAAITLNFDPWTGEEIIIQSGGYMGNLNGDAYEGIDFGTITIVPEPTSLS